MTDRLSRLETLAPFAVLLRHHVPRSQVCQGSCGARRGKVHIDINRGPARFIAANGRSISWGGGRALGLRDGWYERQLEGETAEDLCPRCVELAQKYGVDVPPIPPLARSDEHTSRGRSGA